MNAVTRRICATAGLAAAAVGLTLAGAASAQAATPAATQSYVLHSAPYDVSGDPLHYHSVRAECGTGFHVDGEWMGIGAESTWVANNLNASGDSIYVFGVDPKDPIGGPVHPDYQGMDVTLGNHSWSTKTGSFSWTCVSN